MLVVMGGDGMVHLAAAGRRLHTGGAGHHRHRHRKRRGPLPRPAAAHAARGRRRDPGVAGPAPSTWPAPALTYYVTVLASGFDSLVNERANSMHAGRAGRCATTWRPSPSSGCSSRCPTRSSSDGVRRQLDAMLVAVGNGPSYGGGLRICEGAVARRWAARRRRSSSRSASSSSIRVYPRLFKGTHVTHPAYEHHRVSRVSVAAPGIVAYADGERLGPLPLTVDVAGSRRSLCLDGCIDERVRRVRGPLRLQARHVPARAPATRWRTATACWSPHRPGPARRWSASSPCTWRWHEGGKCFYTTPIKALSNQKFADLTVRYGPERRSACSPVTTRSTARHRSW